MLQIKWTHKVTNEDVLEEWILEGKSVEIHSKQKNAHLTRYEGLLKDIIRHE